MTHTAKNLSYSGTEVIISSNGLKGFSTALKKLKTYSNIVVVSDNIVFPLHGETLLSQLQVCHSSVIFPAGEKSKTIETLSLCWRTMQNSGLDRQSLLIALGGGVVTDIAGFAAATYMRGIDSVFIPTTLMGMVDAAIGGKTGVNLPEGKNLIGITHQPTLIYIPIDFLNTLPEKEFSYGLAEVIKYGMIRDVEFFQFLESNLEGILARDKQLLEKVVDVCCAIKVSIVQQDEKELGIRAILNFGHTFGHALETITNYSRFSHGEAVAIGMCCATRFSQHIGLCDKEVGQRLEVLLKRAGLPTKLPQNIDFDDFISLMTHDKKAVSGKINLILVQEIGKVDRFNEIDKQTIEQVLKESR